MDKFALELAINMAALMMDKQLVCDFMDGDTLRMAHGVLVMAFLPRVQACLAASLLADFVS